MPLLQWESLYSVGNEVLDGDHQGLFADLNELWRQIEQQAEAVDLLTALAQVQLSMEAHFTREEDVLRRLNYPLT
ncbi:MAG TPA: hypothetical protein HPQ04_15105, partial [Rhodospirillaceae bacterium]|nr:hypothetical protein [Rhodospirillaceae bacterium]